MHATNASPETDWRAIDQAIVDLAQKKGELDLEIGRWLLAAELARVDKRCGFGSFAEYVERRLGYDPRATKEKLRVARKLETMPRIRELLRTGQRSWSAVREILRVVTPATEDAWIEKTERMTVRQLESMVAGRKPGELPTDAKDPLIEPRRLVFQLMPEDYALVMAALESMRKEIGPAASSTDGLCALAEHALGGRPAGDASYQTALTVCVSCERTWQQAGGDAVEVSSANAECARCDGELVGFTRVDEGIADANVVVNPTTHVGLERAHEIDPALGARALVKVASRIFGVPLRSMTPRLRAAVRARDRGRCIVPGCTHFRFVEMHHHRPRAQGGPNTLENIYLTCTQHHRAIHEGLLAIEGSPSEGFCVRHAGGTLYGAPRSRAPAGDVAA